MSPLHLHRFSNTPLLPPYAHPYSDGAYFSRFKVGTTIIIYTRSILVDLNCQPHPSTTYTKPPIDICDPCNTNRKLVNTKIIVTDMHVGTSCIMFSPLFLYLLPFVVGDGDVHPILILVILGFIECMVNIHLRIYDWVATKLCIDFQSHEI
jgi:hypothetical protein